MSTFQEYDTNTFYCGANGYPFRGSYTILYKNYTTYPKNDDNGLVWFGIKQGDNFENGIKNNMTLPYTFDMEGGDNLCYAKIGSSNHAYSPDSNTGMQPMVYISPSDIDRTIIFRWHGQIAFKFIQYGSTKVYLYVVDITNIMTNKALYLINVQDNFLSSISISNSLTLPALNYTYSTKKVFYYSDKNINLSNDTKLTYVSGLHVLDGLTNYTFEKIPSFVGQYESNTNKITRVKFNILMQYLGFFYYSSTTKEYQALDMIHIQNYNVYKINDD